MRKKKEPVAVETELNLTRAVLREYDSGHTNPSDILANVMFSFPMTSLSTIKNIIQNHRGQRRPPKKPIPKRPKTPSELLEEQLEKRCISCGLHMTGRACVFPQETCPYDDMLEMVEKARKLREEEQAQKAQVKVAGGRQAEYTKRPRNGNICDDFERELDEMLGEKTIQQEAEWNPYRPGGEMTSETLGTVEFKPDAAIILPKEYVDHAPTEEEGEETYFEDFADILNADVVQKNDPDAL